MFDRNLILKKNRRFQGSPQRQIPSAIQQKLQQALALHQRGKLSDAAKTYEEILEQRPAYFDALHLLGVVACQMKNLNRGEELISKAIKINPNDASAYFNHGNALKDLTRFDEALASYDKAIALKPDYAAAYSSRGNALMDLNRPGEALMSYDRAIALQPDYAETYDCRGNALMGLKRCDEALASYDKAIALNAAYAKAYYNRGNALMDLKRLDEALASYDKAISLKPDYAIAYNNRGSILRALRRFDEALVSFDKAIALKPDDATAFNNRGNALTDLKSLDQALISYDEAISLKVDYAEAYYNRGNALIDLKRFDEAFLSYDKAVSVKPELFGAEGTRLLAKLRLCDWTDFDNDCAHLVSSVKNGKPNTGPFAFLAISSSADDQLRCAKLWVAEKFPPSQKAGWKGGQYKHDRIRVAYVSADFREHPVAYLLAGMIECHDKSRFDVTAISLGPDDNSAMRQRLKASSVRFIDVETFSDEQIANVVRSSEVDILVNLMGFTADSRTAIFAERPAPIQANYLGYAGTMGAPYIDYILADRFVIPEGKRESYSENVVYLPDSFMANDSKRKISERSPHRSECNLPETGFVFCSFNNSYKIGPHIFDIWMRLLRKVDNSVLWLSNTTETAIRNLRREAQNRGVDPSRLVFAQQVHHNEDHLARHELADLFLDTLPYNAHTTASDALWAGLPVLTCLGGTFAGRVAASLLNAIGLPELITTTPEAYENKAIDLATYPEKMAIIKAKLAGNRLTTALFDTKRFTKHIEAAYVAMYERYQAGLAPDHIVVDSRGAD
jgi:protein O-GlcNAc transferase